MCLLPLQVLAVTIGNCPNIKVQNTHVQTHMITCLVDLFPLANGLESAHVAATLCGLLKILSTDGRVLIVDQICLVIPDPCQFADACLPTHDKLGFPDTQPRGQPPEDSGISTGRADARLTYQINSE